MNLRYKINFQKKNKNDLLLKSMTLRSKNLLLRPFSEKDTENVFLGLSHPEVIKYYGVSYSSLEKTEVQMKWFEELEKTGSGRWWAITSGVNGEFYGAIGLNNLNREHNKAEIGFWLLPEFWGNGFIQEAAAKVLKYSFEILKLHRIEAFVESENLNSAKTLIKMGFKHEGQMMDSEIKNGRYINVDIYAILNPGE